MFFPLALGFFAIEAIWGCFLCLFQKIRPVQFDLTRSSHYALLSGNDWPSATGTSCILRTDPIIGD